jgi:hypothetical protein
VPKVLHYDLEWLAILKSLDFLDASCAGNLAIPSAEQQDKRYFCGIADLIRSDTIFSQLKKNWPKLVNYFQV